ncbi:MAG TPA: chitobiase/beta-hexosaminidase C-terminal domain-containing protein, partial [Sumerlaeia bacterium]|nr:chitobiase/beta-hexosaminidase C-terminal domain-containing protein [Sumerlaeia bacterium]
NIFWSVFLRDAAVREWSTQAAPLVVADSSNYGRPGGWHDESVARAVATIQENAKRVRGRGRDFGRNPIVLGGIDPIVDNPPDPEFHGRNAALIADRADGYWIFYELKGSNASDPLPRPVQPIHAEFLKWWTRANRAIVAGKAREFWQADRETLEVRGPEIRVAPIRRGESEATLNAPRDGGALRYTLDGSDPSPASRKYRNPIRLTNPTTLTVALFRNGNRASAVTRRLLYPPLALVEAESLPIAAPWTIETEAEDRSRTYVAALSPDPQKPRGWSAEDPTPALVWEFQVLEAGTYAVMGLVNGPTEIQDSFFAKVDDRDYAAWHFVTRGAWEWRTAPGRFELSEGPHTVTLKPRESGARLDKMAMVRVGAP